MFSKAKVQYLKHACSRSWVCISRGMPKVCFTVERHAEELSSADAACLLCMCFRGLSQELQCPCSRVQTAEGHVLLKAGFLFLVAYQRSNSENVIYLLCHTSSVVRRQASTVQAQGSWHMCIVTRDQLRQDIGSIHQVCSAGTSSLDIQVHYSQLAQSRVLDD